MNCELLTVKKRGFTQNGRTQCSNGTTRCTRMRKREEKKSTRSLLVEFLPVLKEEAGLLHKITKRTAWRGGLQVLEELEAADAHP